MYESTKRARKRYDEKRRVKTVSFNVEKEGDLLAFIDSLPDFSQWVKAQVQAELDKQEIKA